MARKRIYVTLMVDIDNDENEITDDVIDEITMDFEDSYDKGETYVEVTMCGYREEGEEE